MTAPADRRFVLRREYPDPIEDVWAACTESDRLARWYGSHTGTGRPGGTVQLTVTGEVDAGGEVAPPVPVHVRECVAPRRLVVDVPETPERTWRIELTLTAVRGGTALLLEQDLPDGLDPADVHAGWSWYLDRLGAALRDAPMPDWADYAPTGG